MRRILLVVVVVVVAALLTENLAVPVFKEGQREEDVVTRCLVEVLSKALSKPDSQLDQECKDILQAGVKHAPLDKKSEEGTVANEEVVKGHVEKPEAKVADVKDIEALLKSVEEKREIPEDERSQESWSLGDEKDKRHDNEVLEEREKRSGWRPGRFHQRKSKRGEEDDDNERSQESWGLEEKRSPDEEDDYSEEREKRSNWRPGRHHQRKHKRDEEPLGEEPEEERSQESWDVDKRSDGERYKHTWKPTHRYYHNKGLHKRSDEPPEGEEYEDRSQESWGLDKRDWRAGRFHQRRHKRDEELSEEARDDPEEDRSQESWGLDKRDWRAGRHHQRRHKRDEELSEEVRDEPDEERSQEYWDFDTGRYKRDWRPGRHHQRRHKRDEELSEEARDYPDEERSQEYWDFDTGIYKRDWRPGRHHQRRHKRDEELAEEEREEPEGERSQEYWGFDKRHEKGDVEKHIWKPTHRYYHKNVLQKRAGGSSEEEEQKADSEEANDKDEALRYLAEKRNPWIFRSYYHPAWYKRDSDEHAATSDKMAELARLLNYKINQLASHSTQEEAKRNAQEGTLTPQEEKQLENLAAMDMELQKIAAKLHENAA
ncbi:secretogranin-1 isoform X3 [Salarias fasciatus]|uniref:secretogranin-1 isoform X3 n=1 Tax=Salarias fasciatus TaxID=181472 RepID=UPI0011765CD5|nr:secretogranin-1 isoform X3 [Salarias fasciatus]